MSHALPNHTYANLLSAAESAHAQGQYNEAIILAQTAVELFTEHALGRLYEIRHVEYLKDTFEHLLTNYNIGNSKVSRLYIALTDDDITHAPFWSHFTDHTRLRNDLIHEGRAATESQSRASLDAVTALIEHVTQNLDR